MAEKLYYDGKEIGEDAIIEFTGSNYYLSNFYTSDMLLMILIINVQKLLFKHKKQQIEVYRESFLIFLLILLKA